MRSVCYDYQLQERISIVLRRGVVGTLRGSTLHFVAHPSFCGSSLFVAHPCCGSEPPPVDVNKLILMLLAAKILRCSVVHDESTARLMPILHLAIDSDQTEAATTLVLNKLDKITIALKHELLALVVDVVMEPTDVGVACLER